MHGPSALASRGADAHAGVVNVTRIERPMAEFSPEPVPTTFFVPLDGSSVAELALPVARVVSTGFGASLRVENVPAEPDDPTKDGIGEFLATASTDQNDTVVCLACRGQVEQPPFGHRDLADRVLPRLDGPALVVGPHCSSGSFDLGGPIVVCHDGSAAAGQILAPAVTWATALDVPIHLIHVTDSSDVTAGSDARADVADALDRLGSSVQVEWARQLAAGSGDPQPRTRGRCFDRGDEHTRPRVPRTNTPREHHCLGGTRGILSRARSATSRHAHVNGSTRPLPRDRRLDRHLIVTEWT